MEKTILIVEDDAGIQMILRDALTSQGYQVTTADDGRKGLELAKELKPALIILDVMLPLMDGFEVCKSIRKEGIVSPIMMLTVKDEELDKVLGLELGADDYVTKPFSLEELVARVRAILRRTGGEESVSGRLEFTDLELDEDTHEVWRGDRSIELSPTEFNLLRYLMLNATKVVSKAQILDHVWRYDYGGDGSIVESYISYLRRKVDVDGPKLIHTIRGVGYSLRQPKE